MLCVRWYLSFTLSYRDLVAMRIERGIDLVTHDHSALGTALHPGICKAMEPLRPVCWRFMAM